MYYKGGIIVNYCEIGQRIKYYRKLKSYSQETLAEKVNISCSHMSHIETGITKLSLPVLVELARALDISIDNLLFDKANVSNSEKIALFCKELSNCSSDQIDIVLEIAYAAISAIKTKI